MKSYEISIVIPCRDEAENIRPLYDAIEAIRDGKSFEYLFVDDGSLDATLSVIQELQTYDAAVHYLSFSRNFGKEAAIYAGISRASGRFVAVMDADMQDPPELLPEMYRVLTEEAFDCVGTRRVSRTGEPVIRSLCARIFYHMMRRSSRVEIVDGARDYQMMNQKVARAILSVGEYNRFFKGISNWVGYRRKWMEYENHERTAGETKWSLGQLLLYALDGMMSFSTAPLVLASILGLSFCLIAFVLILFVVIRTLIFGDPTSGWPSMVCLIMMVSGVQLFCIGILGQYQAKTYLETKRRPLFLLNEESLDPPEERSAAEGFDQQ